MFEDHCYPTILFFFSMQIFKFNVTPCFNLLQNNYKFVLKYITCDISISLCVYWHTYLCWNWHRSWTPRLSGIRDSWGMKKKWYLYSRNCVDAFVFLFASVSDFCFAFIFAYPRRGEVNVNPKLAVQQR